MCQSIKCKICSLPRPSCSLVNGVCQICKSTQDAKKIVHPQQTTIPNNKDVYHN